MTVNDEGRFDPDAKEVILDAMMADAKEKFGSDLNDDDLAVIRIFYDPVAERLAEAQIDIAEVLNSAQIEHAEGEALDKLCEQIGIARIDARQATGTVRFSRNSPASVDYSIPKGTIVRTDGTDPIEFRTTVSSKLPAGESQVDVNIEAVEGGVHSNVGSNTITVIKGSLSGIEAVTNPAETSGGSNEETDDELRDRASKEVGSGSRASAPALIRAVRRVDGVKSVTIVVNDTNYSDDDGRDAHSFELVVEGGNPTEVADTIMETKAAGDTSLGGYAGTKVTEDVEIPSGQTFPIDYSNPDEVQIFVDMELQVTDEYAGDDAVRDSIISYIGGLFSSGNESGGNLGVGGDVLIGEVEYQIRNTPGIYDVSSLKVGTSANPTGESNITIADTQIPTGDATDGSLTITTTQV